MASQLSGCGFLAWVAARDSQLSARLWFLTIDVVSHDTWNNFVSSSAWLTDHGHIFAHAKYPAVREATGKLESLLQAKEYIIASIIFPKQ